MIKEQRKEDKRCTAADLLACQGAAAYRWCTAQVVMANLLRHLLSKLLLAMLGTHVHVLQSKDCAELKVGKACSKVCM